MRASAGSNTKTDVLDALRRHIASRAEDGINPSDPPGLRLKKRFLPSRLRQPLRLAATSLQRPAATLKLRRLHGTRLGLKFNSEDWRFDAFLNYRFEGFNRDNVPTSMAGLGVREPGWDAGVSLRRRMDWGTPYVEALHDVSNSSDGTELRAGYWNEWRRGRLSLKPHLMAGWRSASLNNHYYGTPTYEAGAGIDLHAALYARYALTESWSLYGSIGTTRHSSEITSSPVARGGLQNEMFVGFLYDWSPKQARWAPESKPLIVKALYGNSSDCDMLQIMRFSCTTRHTVDNTDIAALHVGRMLIDSPDGWPVQLAGFIGAQRHLEKAYQDDFWSVMAFFKAYWYGFPWDKYVRTRRHRQRPVVLRADLDDGAARPGEARPRQLEAPQLHGSEHRLPRRARDVPRRGRVAPLRRVRQVAVLRQRERRLELHLCLNRNHPTLTPLATSAY